MPDLSEEAFLVLAVARGNYDAYCEEIKKAGEAIQQTASGLNLTAGWPYQPASSDAVTEAAPAEPKTSQLELGLDTSAGADSRKA